MARPSQVSSPEQADEASGPADRGKRADWRESEVMREPDAVRGNATTETPNPTATESEREKPALKTDPQAVADAEILADVPREPIEPDSAPPSIPSAAAVFSEDSTRA